MRTMPSTIQNSAEECSWSLTRLVSPSGSRKNRPIANTSATTTVPAQMPRGDLLRLLLGLARGGSCALAEMPSALKPIASDPPSATMPRSTGIRSQRWRAQRRGERERRDLDLAERSSLRRPPVGSSPSRASDLDASPADCHASLPTRPPRSPSLGVAAACAPPPPSGARRASSRPRAPPGRRAARRAGRSARRRELVPRRSAPCAGRCARARSPGGCSPAPSHRRPVERTSCLLGPCLRLRAPLGRPVCSAALTALGDPALEALDASTGVHQLLPSRVERVAVGAHLDVISSAWRAW